MITTPVTKEKLEQWKELWQKNIDSFKPNRINGRELNEYFIKKYSPLNYDDKKFLETVWLNAIDKYGKGAVKLSDIFCYTVDGDIYIGIDTGTGYFHIESENIEKCVTIYDDLYVKRGLDSEDIKNYVIAGQYIELIQK